MVASKLRESGARTLRLLRMGRCSLILIVALWLALGTFTAWDARTELQSVDAQTETLADALAAHTSRVLREADQLAALIAWQAQRHGVSVPLGDYVSSGLFKLDVSEQVSVIDRHGIVRSSTIPGFTPVNVAGREHFTVHVNDASSRLFIGKAVIGRVSGKPSIQLSRRIDDAAGNFLGVVVISMAPSCLTEFYDALRIGNRGLIWVVGTGDFVTRARRSGSANATDLYLPPQNPLRTALTRAPRGQFNYLSPVDGVERAVSYQTLADYPVAVVVGFSTSDFLHSFRARTTALFAAGGLLTILILVAGAKRARLLEKMRVAAERERDANEFKILKAQRIESLFAAIPDAAVGFSVQGEIDGFNPHLLTLLGWTTHELARATPTLLTSAFFRQDQGADRTEKALRFASMLCDKSAEGSVSAVFRLEVPQPVVYELRVERRYGSSTGTVALIRDITEQSRINDSERDLDSTLHAIGDAVVSVDEHGCIKRMNSVAENFSGWLSPDAIGKLHSEVFPFASVTTGCHAAVPVEDVLKTGQLLRLGDRRTLISREGEKRNVAISAAPIRDSGNRVSGVVLVVRDVSHEYASEQALLRSEARYRRLIALSPYAVFLAQNRQIRFANPKALEMLGAHTARQIVGRSVLDFLHPDSIPIVEERIARMREKRTVAPPMEEKWLRLDGSTFIGEAMAVPYEIDGAPGALVMLQDISSRKEAEAERDRFFALSLDLTCIIAEPRGHFKRVNPAFSRVLGWTSEELLSRPLIEFVHPDDREMTLREIELHRSGDPIDHFENRYLCKDGSSRWLAWKAIQLDGIVYATARDVTESRSATEQLEQARAEAEAASRTKSSFLATMSHEIRTPMNGVIGMTDVLARTALTPDQDDMVSTIRESANSLLTIIDDILDFSKIEAGRLQIESTPVAIVDLVENVSTSLTPVAKRAGVRLATFVAPDVPDVVLSDDTRLKQLLYNLVGNAIKFSGGRPSKAGSVSVRLDLSREAPLEVSIQVADNGIGMSRETLAGLFTPFSQAEVSTTRRFGGTGLGLAICRRLVDLMGGDLSVLSTLGEGSTFTVRLPFDVPVAQPSCERSDLNGVCCVVMRSTSYDFDSICAWLQRERAQLAVADDLSGVEQAIQNSRLPVLVVREDLGDLSASRVFGSGDSAPILVSELRIVPGLRCAARAERHSVVVIGSEGLRRKSLKDAALLAVGRSTADIAASVVRVGQDRDEPPMTVAQAREDGRLILVAEDDEINQKVILRQLALLGHVAEVAGDGTEALDLWRTTRYALLLTDLHMPKMDGYELVETIRREEQSELRLPVIALTANAIQGEAARAAALGMDGYLTKPLQLSRLQAVLEQHFPAREALRLKKMRSVQLNETDSAAVVDIDVLKSIVGDDADVVRELLGDYLKSVRNLATELRTHCAQGRGREAGSVAHKLKSSSRSIGAIALGDLCAQLENAGKAGDLATLASWVQQFDAALVAVEQAIAHLLETT
ncbi:PAS domain S-box protein [Paraburkholderia sp. RL17-337-BIB-A]|uniref:PAS domain S-box protein n=1 Tax=Paraburkholderia sp. RL17-337-BIB-A TaxID=3031636 RepID=UPI0038BA36F2